MEINQNGTSSAATPVKTATTESKGTGKCVSSSSTQVVMIIYVGKKSDDAMRKTIEVSTCSPLTSSHTSIFLSCKQHIDRYLVHSPQNFNLWHQTNRKHPQKKKMTYPKANAL